MRLQEWRPNFNPYRVNSPIVNVWIRIFELPLEYFYVPNIHAITSAICPVISIDERTQKRERCHFARVLVEIELRKPREEFIKFEITRTLLYCFYRVRPTPAPPNPDKGKQPSDQQARPNTRRWVQVRNDSPPRSPFNEGTSSDHVAGEPTATQHAIPTITTTVVTSLHPMHATTSILQHISMPPPCSNTVTTSTRTTLQFVFGDKAVEVATYATNPTPLDTSHNLCMFLYAW